MHNAVYFAKRGKPSSARRSVRLDTNEALQKLANSIRFGEAAAREIRRRSMPKKHA